MARWLDHFARTPVLWVSLFIFLACGILFGRLIPLAGGELLDLQMSGEAASAILSGLSDGQRSAHIAITAIVDTVYPLAYGAVLAGLIWRFGGGLRRLFVVPALTGVLADFAENGVQIAALLGAEGVLVGKDILTPLKFGAIALAALIALVLLLAALLRRVTARG